MTARTQQWAALGTYAQIVVDDDAAAADALRIGQQLVATIDATCSRFRADSDLSRASDRAGEWVRVNPLLVRAVDAAVEAARSTGGLVDPTLGRNLATLGYDRDLRDVRTQSKVTSPASPGQPAARRSDNLESTASTPLRRGAWRDIDTDPIGWIRVPEGCALDLGATGKAFAADLVANSVVDQLGCSVIVSLGGDVAAVTSPQHGGWQVLVSDTEGGDLDAPGQVVVLTNGGLATSSTKHRRWNHHGASVHHIIDPRSGQPATETVVSATVCAASCVEANAATTAAIVLGDAAADWLAARDISALLVHADGRATRVADWPAAQQVAAAC